MCFPKYALRIHSQYHIMREKSSFLGHLRPLWGGGGARAPSPVPGSGTGQVAYLVRSPLFMAVIEELSHTTSNCPYVSLKKKRRNNGPHREQKMFYFSNLTSFLRNVGKQCRIIQMYLKQVLLRLGCCAICYFPNLKNI